MVEVEHMKKTLMLLVMLLAVTLSVASWFCQENETPKIELKMVSVIA